MENRIVERNTLHILIDEIPDNCLSSVEPILSYLAGKLDIETDLTNEEKNWISEGRKQYKEHPEDFIPLESIKIK